MLKKYKETKASRTTSASRTKDKPSNAKNKENLNINFLKHNLIIQRRKNGPLKPPGNLNTFFNL